MNSLSDEVEFLINALGSPSDKVRWAMVENGSGDLRAVEPLRQFLEDPDVEARKIVAQTPVYPLSFQRNSSPRFSAWDSEA